jgi:hypothetical protein
MSDLYGPLYKALMPKRYDKRDKAGNPTALNPAFMEVGSVFEEALEPALKERLSRALDATLERPGELTTTDGTNVIYSPDAFIFDGGRFYLGEFKLTWMTNTNITDPKFDKYLCQMKAYCYHLQTPYARLYTLFVNGAGPKGDRFGPEIGAWEFEFTPKELLENWRMLKRFAERHGMLPQMS